MTDILILCENLPAVDNIVSLIGKHFPGKSFRLENNLLATLERIKKDKPQKVVVDLSIRDKEGKNLLDLLGNWEFDVIIYANDEFYEIDDGKKANKQGYVLKKIDDF